MTGPAVSNPAKAIFALKWVGWWLVCSLDPYIRIQVSDIKIYPAYYCDDVSKYRIAYVLFQDPSYLRKAICKKKIYFAS